MAYIAYILECADGTFYSGSTNDIEKRLHKHNHLKSGAHYTKIRRPVVLRYSESVPDFATARAREAEFKRWTHEGKMKFLAENLLQ